MGQLPPGYLHRRPGNLTLIVEAAPASGRTRTGQLATACLARTRRDLRQTPVARPASGWSTRMGQLAAACLHPARGNRTRTMEAAPESGQPSLAQPARACPVRPVPAQMWARSERLASG